MNKFNINDWIKGKVRPSIENWRIIDETNTAIGETSSYEYCQYVCDAINEKREREELRGKISVIDNLIEMIVDMKLLPEDEQAKRIFTNELIKAQSIIKELK